MGVFGCTGGSYHTSDGADLFYLQNGSGPTIVLLPGWSQTAAMFKGQLTGLGDRYRVIALDHRGHGESSKVDYGYRISRLSQDLREFILELDLENITLLGNSMGASVMWGYWNLYGSDRLARLVVDDEPAVLTLKDTETDLAREQTGELFPWPTLVETCDSLESSDGAEFTRGMIENMMSDLLSPEIQQWVISENMKLPRKHASTLLLDHSLEDWRDVIPRIDIPTLVLCGKGSVVPWKSQVWIHEQIPGSRIEIIEVEDGGHHFSFLENPGRFNDILASFIADS